jgi:hypothetical protein
VILLSPSVITYTFSCRNINALKMREPSWILCLLASMSPASRSPQSPVTCRRNKLKGCTSMRSRKYSADWVAVSLPSANRGSVLMGIAKLMGIVCFLLNAFVHAATRLTPLRLAVLSVCARAGGCLSTTKQSCSRYWLRLNAVLN